MMIESLGIENYRGISKGTLFKLGAVNILLGPNGCGKSTVLEAFYLLKHARNDVVFETNPENWIAQQRNESTFDDSWWFQNKIDRPIGIQVKFDSLNDVVIFSVDKSRNPMGRFEYRQANPDAIDKYRERIFLIDASAKTRMIEQPLWEKEIAKRRLDKQLVSALNDIYHLNIEGLTQSGKRVMALFPDYGLHIDSLGAGMRTAFRLLALCHSVQPTVMLIEEIDVFQHYEALPLVAKAILDISVKLGTQFFMTTHSRETYGAFLAAAKEKGFDSLNMYTLSLDQGGKLTTRMSERDDAISLENAGRDLRSD